MGEIDFKGELHTIPAGAALVLAVDRHLTREQAEQIKRHVNEALPGREVLVVGPGVTVSALERLPVVSMGVDMASGPDMTALAAVSQQTGSITIINRTSHAVSSVHESRTPAGERVLDLRQIKADLDTLAAIGSGKPLEQEGQAPGVSQYAVGRGYYEVDLPEADRREVWERVVSPLYAEPKGEDPMEAARALVKKHGGGSGG